MDDSGKTQSDEKKYLYLLHEQRLSNMMTSLYLAIIGANENAVLLQREDPWDIDPERFRGTELTRHGMSQICEWLELLKLFTKNEEIYNEQFLEPIRLMSKLVQSYRDMSKRSTELEGWVFSRSKPAADVFSNEKRVTLSMVVPKIQTVMAIKVSESVANGIAGGYFVFGGCQPVGLVNRIHQVELQNRLSQKILSLSEFDFLFTPFEYIKKLNSSIEMENFCEVESIQSEIRHHMGFPFVSFAKVLQVTPPMIILKENDGENVLKLLISDHFYKNMGRYDPSVFEGKHVRFFGVQWYDSHSKNAVKFEMPELFFIEEEKDPKRLKFESAAGLVRLHGKIPVSEIENILDGKIESDGCIEINDGMASFRYSGSYDKIVANFLEAMSKIRQYREKLKLNAIQVSEDQVIDKKKMSAIGLASLIKHHRILYDILLDYLNQFDHIGEYSIDSAISSLNSWSEGIIKRKINFMKYLGIFEDDKTVRITKGGFKIATLVTEKDLDARFSSISRGIISIKDIEREGIPPSILLDYLRKGKARGYLPVTLNGLKTEMFWTRGGTVDESRETLISEYTDSRNEILNVMRSVSFPITPQGIVERMNSNGNSIGRFAVNLFLEEAEKTQRIRRSGDSWEYTTEARILDMFQSFPQETFDIKTIFEKISIGTIHEKEVLRILDDFKKAKVVSTINGRWTCNVNMVQKTNNALGIKIRRYIMSILDKNKKTDVERLKSYVEGALAKGNIYGSSSERRNAIRAELEKMKNEGIIDMSEFIVSKN